MNGVTALNLPPIGPGGSLVPVSYDYLVDVTQDLEGLVGKYFDLEDHSVFRF